MRQQHSARINVFTQMQAPRPTSRSPSTCGGRENSLARGETSADHSSHSRKGAIDMPRTLKAPLPQPLFGEPVFNEGGVPTPDPTTFRVAHDKNADDQLYGEVQKLLSKDTVSFKPSRGQPGDLYTLASALGTQGAADVQAISKSGRIVFHAVGDTGAAYLT